MIWLCETRLNKTFHFFAVGNFRSQSHNFLAISFPGFPQRSERLMLRSEYRFKHSRRSLEKQTKCRINVWDRRRRPENLFSEESSLHFGNTAVFLLLFMISVSADSFFCGQSVLSALPPQRSLHVYEFVLATVFHSYRSHCPLSRLRYNFFQEDAYKKEILGPNVANGESCTIPDNSCNEDKLCKLC